MNNSQIISPKRVAVLGCSGSGKSTLAAVIAAKMQLPLVATDGVFWTSDWKPTPAAEVREWLQSATSAEHWVLDGNFDSERASYWARADLAVWLDYPRSTTVWRVLKRNFRWWLSREPTWGGNRMILSRAVGGVRHAWCSHGLKRRTYPAFFAEFPGLKVVRIDSQRSLDEWLDKFDSSQTSPEWTD